MVGEIETLDLIGDLPPSWKVARFGDVLEGGTRNGIYKSKEFHGRGAKVVNMGELFANPRLRDVPMKRVELSDSEMEKSCLKQGDLLFARRSLVAEGAGKCIVVAEIKEPTTFESSIIRARPNPQVADSLFLYYLFNSPYGAYVLLTIRRQVAVSGITGTDLVELPLPLPPLAEQKAIAAVLGALDDKIELNRRMNATLEAIARALFQSWFVDFDPVRANMDRRGQKSERGRAKSEMPDALSDFNSHSSLFSAPAALDPTTAALFPDSFQESSLGPIPHGWEVCPLSEKIQLLGGGTPKTSEPAYWDGDIPWYSVRDAPSETDVWVIHTDKHVTKLGVANSAAQIFPEKTTIISARGTVGKLALTAVPMAMNQSCYGVRGITGYGDYFTYYSLREATAQLQQRTHGTVFDTITTETFKTLDCIFPTPKITAAFDKLVEPLLGQIRANLHQSRILATLRDTLLPKLLSGEVVPSSA